MGKVENLDSAKSSQDVKDSLKYYLSAGLHHRTVGRFVTLAFFSDGNDNTPDKQKDVVEPNQNTERENSANIEESSPKTAEKFQETRSSDISTEAPKRSKLQEKVDEDKVATAGTYSVASEPGPFANFEQTRKDPSLVWQKVKLSKEVLATAKTVFPIDLFPDTVILDRTTLNITKRTFFWSGDTLSIRIEDILNAHVNVGPFFGSLTIASRVLSSEDHFTISNLKRKDAIHLKHMIQGYIIALHNEIDVSHLSKNELIETIRELGHDLNS